MSYSINLEMKDGTLTLASHSGDIPDGKYTLGGHEDESTRNISISATRYEGEHYHIAIQASAHAKK